MSEDQNQTLVSMNNFLKNSGESIDITSEKYNKLMFLYNSALKIVNTKLEILKEELKEFYDYSPIEDITSRIKKPENVIEKLSRKDYAPTYANLINHLNDVAGIRIICNFKDDVYKIVELIESFQDIRIIKKKDFVYILGAFCLGNKERTKYILSRLNGRKFLVIGNHDKRFYKKSKEKWI